jgi:eukaryotic-like serine/threonine-protein kinase
MAVSPRASLRSVELVAAERSPPGGEPRSPRFRVERVLGAGEMGIVVAAHHLALDKRVAIKLMRPELRMRKELVRRFLREARTLARLTSPHAVRLFEAGALADGTPYLVMEYLEGTDLATWLGQRGVQSPACAAAIVRQACNAIAEAHAQGFVHRDLKPANLFVTDAGAGGLAVKVLDLGSCKPLDEPDDLETASTTALGTPAYMAPEQMRSACRSDARCDVWSLGVILYELVTGRVPFHARTLPEARLRALEPCPPMTPVSAPPEFEATVARCLAKDPSARFQDAGELAAALAPLAEPSSATPERWRAAQPAAWPRSLPMIVLAALACGMALVLATQ